MVVEVIMYKEHIEVIESALELAVEKVGLIGWIQSMRKLYVEIKEITGDEI